MFFAPCPEDLFWHLARRLRKISALPNTGMKILEQRFGSDWLSNLNEPYGRLLHQEVAFRDMTFL